MVQLLCCLLFLIANDAAFGQQHYTFSASINGWLKLHQVSAKWRDAFSTCYSEGAVLASPLNKNIMDNLRVQMVLNNVDRPVYLGVNALQSDGYFVSLEGVPLDDMPVVWGSYGDGGRTEDCLTFSSDGKVYTSSCTEYRPYFCYKKEEKEVLNECGTFDTEYKLNETSGSCYKLHTESRRWSEAHKICSAEGGYLVVLNNEEEVRIVMDLFSSEDFSYRGDFALTHVGLIDWNKDFAWITVTGEKIDDVYSTWEPHCPDRNNDNRCVQLLADGSLSCSHTLHNERFVCEKNPNKIQFKRVDD